MDVIHHLWNHPPQMMVGNKISIIWIRLCLLAPANKCKASSLCCNTTPIVIVTNSNAMIITISIDKNHRNAPTPQTSQASDNIATATKKRSQGVAGDRDSGSLQPPHAVVAFHFTPLGRSV